ncbi:GspE/PulE family protein [Litoribrevibacter albus]|uniref:Secretion pathway ATPase n=1 Tax=Litoribrevibacter albus TaxID=1473156 RepID=A0AA37SFZ3_9GAMM|nr:GspE/PulE family protein [Litoribrevibacter albus]GLQ33651.1 secretion pathway ATPase [Litoribrevibacter albus]
MDINKLLGRKLTLRDLVDILKSQNRLSAEDAAELFSNVDSSKNHSPIEQLAALRLADKQNSERTLDSATIAELLARVSGQHHFHIDPLKVDVASITSVMSYEFAQQHQILALEVTPTEVIIGSSEPFIDDWESGLRHVLRKEIKRAVVSPEDIRRYTVEFYNLARSVNSAATDRKGQTESKVTNMEQLLELGRKGSHDANDKHIVNIVDWLLQYAFDQRASDIHLEPRRDQGVLRFRIDGVLHAVYQFPVQVAMAVLSRIKILGRMNVAEKRKPQDGRLKTKSLEGNEVELRLSTMPTAFGEKLVMRVFDPDVLLKPFSELGLIQDDFKRWNQMTSENSGIVFVTGPTGSGKTTTLYSTLKALATPEVNVCTIEDPIEMVEPAFNQMQVQHNIDLTFASGVRSLLRQDPDIIMVGEIRDLETAEIAIEAALTGHLVLSTLHTNDAPTAVTRLQELGIPPYLIKATVLGVMAQRLVRRLCPHCKTSQPLDEGAWERLTRPWRAGVPTETYGPVGCLECRDTGYLGREGIYEVMPMSESLKEFVHEQTDLSQLRAQAYKEGMRSLRISGAQKVARGITTIEEVMRVAPLN